MNLTLIQVAAVVVQHSAWRPDGPEHGDTSEPSPGLITALPPPDPDPDPCTIHSFSYRDLTQLTVVRGLFVFVYLVVMTLAVVGNLLVIFAVALNKHMRTVTNCYIVNLAVSDLLVSCLVLPLKLVEYTAPCAWGLLQFQAICPVLYYVLPVFVFASILTLVAISYERYHAIVHPLSAIQVHSRSRTRKVLVLTWLLPVVIAAPYLYCKSYHFSIYSPMGSVTRQICNDRFDDIDAMLYGKSSMPTGYFRRGYFFFLFVALYAVPMAVIGGTCAKISMALMRPIGKMEPSKQGERFTRKREENKRKVARMILLVAVTFVLCWSPFFLVSLVSQAQEHSFLKDSNFLFTMLTTHLVGFLNSCLNPFIYTAMSDKFRRHFMHILRSLCCCIVRPVEKSRWRERYAEGCLRERGYSMGPYPSCQRSKYDSSMRNRYLKNGRPINAELPKTPESGSRSQPSTPAGSLGQQQSHVGAERGDAHAPPELHESVENCKSDSALLAAEGGLLGALDAAGARSTSIGCCLPKSPRLDYPKMRRMGVPAELFLPDVDKIQDSILDSIAESTRTMSHVSQNRNS